MAFVFDISIPGTSYQLLFGDGSYNWIGEENVRKMPFLYYEDETQLQSSEAEDLDQTTLQHIEEEEEQDALRTRSSSESEEILVSIPLDEDDAYPADPPARLQKKPTVPLIRKPSALPSSFTKDPRKKRFSLRRTKPKKPSCLSRLACCCCRSQNTYDCI